MSKRNGMSVFDNLSVPVIAAPMFLVSGPDLVVETCKAGAIGTFPSLNQRSAEGYDEWLSEIGQRLSAHDRAGGCPAPFGINLIVHGSNKRVEKDLEITVAHKVPLVITSLGIRPEVIAAIQGYGGKVFHDVTQLRHAQKAAEAGVDGLIAVCAGAGGHAGTLSPFAFTAEIRSFFEGTLVLAGSITNGRQVAAARLMGADLAYVGTRFIATRESMAPEGHKQDILEATSSDILYTDKVSGIPANFLKASLARAGLLEEGAEGGKPFQFGEEEVKAWRDVWSAGQGASTVEDLPSVAELVARLREEYEASAAILSGGSA